MRSASPRLTGEALTASSSHAAAAAASGAAMAWVDSRVPTRAAGAKASGLGDTTQGHAWYHVVNRAAWRGRAVGGRIAQTSFHT